MPHPHSLTHPSQYQFKSIPQIHSASSRFLSIPRLSREILATMDPGPLSPNTSAFLSYIAAAAADTVQNEQQQKNAALNPTSLPPSAFFNMPLPGRDTPEDTPPSSNEPSVSPERALSLSDSEPEGTRGTKSASGQQQNQQHKRKAAGRQSSGRKAEDDSADEDEDEDDSDAPASGHDDKRQHQNKSSGRKGGRKSVGDSGDARPGKELSKAARRKEQNRAAQKAFRERREAKVKDLEDKVRSLEEKTYGQNIENENLRNILKRLQEENVALKQSGFTFNMPMGGAGTNTPPLQAVGKPPSPPQSNDDNSLRSIHDVPGLTRHNSGPSTSSSKEASPESLISIPGASRSNSTTSTKDQQTRLSEAEMFADSAYGLPSFLRVHKSPTESSVQMTPPSSSTDNKSEIDALWASFYPKFSQDANPTSQFGLPPGVFPEPDTVRRQQQLLQQQQQQQQQQTQAPLNAPSPFSQFMSQVAASNAISEVAGKPDNKAPPTPMSFSDHMRGQPAGIANVGQAPSGVKTPPLPNDLMVGPAAQNATKSMAYRDTAQQQQTIDWVGMNQNSMDDFLASLSGAGPIAEADANNNVDDDFFNAQLQQILQPPASSMPGMEWNLFAGAGNGFSPTNYLNTSPSPIVSASVASGSISNTGSPANTKSSATSPDSSCPSEVSGPVAVAKDVQIGDHKMHVVKEGERIIRIIDEEGRLIQPSELWARVGLDGSNGVDLVIDDLCDQMKNKASCKEGQTFLSVSDAEYMLRHRSCPLTNDPTYAERNQVPPVTGPKLGLGI